MIQIYGVIGQDVTADKVLKNIQAYKGEELDIYINSVGGDVFEGLAIYEGLKSCEVKTKAYIMGIAASAGSVIAMGCDEIVMGENSMLMIHNAWTPQGGNALELKQTATRLEKIDGRLAEIYSKKSGLPVEIVESLMKEETYITAEEAVEYGFISKTENDLKLVALATNGKEKTKKETTMENKNIDDEKVSVGVVTKILNALGFTPKAMDEPMPEEEEVVEEEAVEEAEESKAMDEEEVDEMEALKAELEATKAELEAMKADTVAMEEEEKELEAQAKTKEDLVFTALQNNQITVAKAKEFLALKDCETITSALASLDNNATGFGKTGMPKEKGEQTPEEIFALYEQADEKEKFAIFKAHKQIILNQASKQ